MNYEKNVRKQNCTNKKVDVQLWNSDLICLIVISRYSTVISKISIIIDP